MPTVDCDRIDCDHHGFDICIAKRVIWENGQCLMFSDRQSTRNLAPPFKACCHKGGGKYKSDRVTKVFK